MLPQKNFAKKISVTLFQLCSHPSEKEVSPDAADRGFGQQLFDL
jgi:hypothetical protein